MRRLDAQDQYNLTIVEPSFAIDPWYADNPTDPNLHYEAFVTKDLVPWVTQNLTPPAGSQPLAPPTGPGQNWLIGFSSPGWAQRISCSRTPTSSRWPPPGIPGGHDRLRPVRV